MMMMMMFAIWRASPWAVAKMPMVHTRAVILPSQDSYEIERYRHDIDRKNNYKQHQQQRPTVGKQVCQKVVCSTGKKTQIVSVSVDEGWRVGVAGGWWIIPESKGRELAAKNCFLVDKNCFLLKKNCFLPQKNCFLLKENCFLLKENCFWLFCK